MAVTDTCRSVAPGYDARDRRLLAEREGSALVGPSVSRRRGVGTASTRRRERASRRAGRVHHAPRIGECSAAS